MLKNFIIITISILYFEGCAKQTPKTNSEIIKEKVEDSWKQTKSYSNEKYKVTKKWISNKYNKVKDKLFD